MHQFSRQRDVLHAQLVTIIAGGGPAQCEQQHLGQPRLLTAHTCGDARSVMIAQDPIGPGFLGQSRFVTLDSVTNGACFPDRHGHELEIEGEVNFVELLAVVRHQTLQWQIEFADEYALAIAFGHCTHLLHNIMHARLVYDVMF